jgi:hypothetical protein
LLVVACDWGGALAPDYLGPLRSLTDDGGIILRGRRLLRPWDRATLLGVDGGLGLGV